ncbi:MAG TPA: carboxypeptidase-like regulatory domain-containing protein [Candidatus Nitrosotalea sp.]|nr:carboxypeptidase-like regulatory domain-containing protein [Candidatus Nitrosotalea sp.]
MPPPHPGIRLRFGAALALGLLVMALAACGARAAPTAEVFGVVRAAPCRPVEQVPPVACPGVAGVRVVVWGQGGSWSGRSDSSGRYRIRLPSGRYRISVRAGLAPRTVQIQLASDQRLRRDLTFDSGIR